MKSIGLFFGSFNPVHIGHLILANAIVENSDLAELWFVVSPQNPFKKKENLLGERHRLDMVARALTHYPKMRASDIEFSLPKPNYTINTLAYLEEKYPGYLFSIIVGEDNLCGIHRWKNAEKLIEKYRILVYPRKYTHEDREMNIYFLEHENVTKIQAPKIEISSTHIREMIKLGKNIRPLLPPEVYAYLEGSPLYKSQ
ncbi:MAG: nicotinate-nucleotide adenylyltransferase [Bergeyella sp.]|nr:nicotinate-nucleotide adenylyltransferase [Bergeyella sp.]